MKTKIVVAEDNELFREIIVQYLEKPQHYEVCADVANGEQALAAVKRYHPHVLLLDIEMPVINGWQVLEKLQQENNPVHTLVLSCYDAKETVLRALELGAMGLVSKDASPSQLYKAIETITGKQIYAEAHLIRTLFNHKNSAAKQPEQFHFTQEEITLITYVNQERTTTEISKLLFKSEKVIETMRSNLIKRSGCKTMVGVLNLAKDAGIILSEKISKSL